MTQHHVLVVYGTKQGSTAEIARWTGEALEALGVPADVRPAGEDPDPGGCTAVVLGSCLYTGRWHRDAVRWARRNAEALRQLPVWLFSSGPLDTSADERELPPTSKVAKIATELDVLGHRTFGGRLRDRREADDGAGDLRTGRRHPRPRRPRDGAAAGQAAARGRRPRAPGRRRQPR